MTGVVSSYRCGAAPELPRETRRTGFPFNPSQYLDEAMKPRQAETTLPDRRRQRPGTMRARQEPGAIHSWTWRRAVMRFEALNALQFRAAMKA